MRALELEGRVALVTGGASGIGLASARAFAAEGASVIVADLDGAAAEAAAQQMGSADHPAIAFQVDVSSLAELRTMFDFVGKTFGRLNVLFSHAGVQGPIGLDITEEQFNRTIAINLKSHFFATNFALPLMRPCAPHASIIYTSSTSGLRAGTHSPLYGATKAGILMLMRSVAKMLGPEQIRANAVCPGPVETTFSKEFAQLARASAPLGDEAYQAVLKSSGKNIPMGRVAQSSDVSGVAVFLASDHSVYLTGAAIPIDGGLTA